MSTFYREALKNCSESAESTVAFEVTAQEQVKNAMPRLQTATFELGRYKTLG